MIIDFFTKSQSIYMSKRRFVPWLLLKKSFLEVSVVQCVWYKDDSVLC